MTSVSGFAKLFSASALLALGSDLDALYQETVAGAFTATELRIAR
jgi:hypothetical protein